MEMSRPLKTVMNQLVELYAVYWLLENSGDFLRVSAVILIGVIC